MDEVFLHTRTHACVIKICTLKCFADKTRIFSSQAILLHRFLKKIIRLFCKIVLYPLYFL